MVMAFLWPGMAVLCLADCVFVTGGLHKLYAAVFRLAGPAGRSLQLA